MPNDLWFDLETLVSTAEAESVAVFGDSPTDFLDAYAEQRAVLRARFELYRQPNSQVPDFEHGVDVAILIHPTDQRAHCSNLQMISRVRDVISRQFCLVVPLDTGTGDGWQLSELLALGMRRVSQYPLENGTLGLFSYSLRDYKNTPDWLNADNWANPEMWGKYWW
jgi:hypothetical protein